MSFSILYRYFIVVVVLFISFSLPAFALEFSKEKLFQFATLAARDGKYDAAIDLFQKTLQVDPQFAPAYNSLGLVYISLEDQDEAIRYFKLATDLNPDYHESWNNLGKAYYAKGDFIHAEKAFARSLAIVSDQPEIHAALGWVYLLGTSRAKEAIFHFNRAIEKMDDGMLYYGLGLARLLLGERVLVFEQVTALRSKGKEEQARRLEIMIRDKVQLVSEPGSPLMTSKDAEESVYQQTLGALNSGRSDADNKAPGVQVRL